MRILFEAHHPAHIHFFKNAIKRLQDEGHSCLMIGRDRDVMQELLRTYSWIPTTGTTKAAKGKKNRFPIAELPRRQLKVAQTILRYQPDLMISLMGSYSQFAPVFNVPNWIFTDSEFQNFNHRVSHPFADRIYTPECFYKPLGKKQLKYRSYHELAFLHPTHFKPDPSALKHLPGAEPNNFAILRLSAWDTLHDINHGGLGDLSNQIVDTLSNKLRLFIIPEGGNLPPEWESYRFTAPPQLLHDVLAFARVVVTEGASTASEAACLGTPCFYVNSTGDRGYLLDQESRCEHLSCFKSPDTLVEKLQSEIYRKFEQEDRVLNQQRILDDHIDPVEFLTQEIAEFFRT